MNDEVMSIQEVEQKWLGHMFADRQTLAQELRLTEPDLEFATRLAVGIIKSATVVLESIDQRKREAN